VGRARRRPHNSISSAVAVGYMQEVGGEVNFVHDEFVLHHLLQNMHHHISIHQLLKANFTSPINITCFFCG
jgi:hypothetical protein